MDLNWKLKLHWSVIDGAELGKRIKLEEIGGLEYWSVSTT